MTERSDIDKLAFLQRNGKVRAFCAIALMDDGTCSEFMEIPDEHAIEMSGLTAILARDVQSLIPMINLSECME